MQRNKDCTTDGAAFCHSDNTCVACETGKQKCHASDGGLLICDANGAWPSTNSACSKGHECLAGATSCTPKDGYCTTVDNCTDALYPVCSEETSLCSCPEGQTTCKTEAGQAALATCSAGTWSAYSNCDSKTSVCNGEQTACVECTDDKHCGDFYRCDMATNKCLTDSTIAGCYAQFFGERELMGDLDFDSESESESNWSTKLLCGKTDQNIWDYTELPTNMSNVLKQSCDFEADPSSLVNGKYKGLISLQLDGEMPIACTNNRPITDFRNPAPIDAGIEYVATKTWNHVIDFEDCPTTDTAANGSCASGLSYTNGMTPLDGESITGKSLKLSTAGEVTITAPNGVSRLTFDIKTLDASNGTVRLWVNENAVWAAYMMSANTSHNVYKTDIDVSDNTVIRITTSQPLVIDNLKWMNHPLFGL